MKSLEIARRKQGLDYLFSKVSLYADDPEMQSHWSRYLCVLVSGFIEAAIRISYSEYSRGKAAPYITNFVDDRLKGFQNPNMGKILQVTKSFSPEWETKLKELTDGRLKDAIDSVVANRNKIAHGESVGVSYVRMKEYYQAVVEVLELIDQQCSS